jgi:rhodanese-related sulfurtransferase
MIHMLRHLRLRRITPLLLHERITSGKQIAILDLLDFEDEHEGRAGIPGSVRMAPSRLRSRSRVVVPEHLEMVLYCSSSGEFTSARAAVALQKKGISNVWVLQSQYSEDAAERFVIRLIEDG